MTDSAHRPPTFAGHSQPLESAVGNALLLDRPSPKRRRRSVLWFLTVLVVGAGLWLVYASVLARVAGCLVVDEPANKVQYVCVLDWYDAPDGDRCYDVAVDLHGRQPDCSVLLIESRPQRLIETGVLPSFEMLSRRELEARGLSRQSVAVTRSDGQDYWATARALRAWLANRSDATAVLLCEEFRSAHVRYALDIVLDPATAARVRVRGLPDRRFDQTNWWMSRDGFKAFGVGWLRLLHGWCVGGDHPPPPFSDADEYEKLYRRTISETSP